MTCFGRFVRGQQAAGIGGESCVWCSVFVGLGSTHGRTQLQSNWDGHSCISARFRRPSLSGIWNSWLGVERTEHELPSRAHPGCLRRGRLSNSPAPHHPTCAEMRERLCIE
eukprot:SAG25_NODE_1_length_41698_cov_149.842015_10_plen_111_part_00